MPSHGEAESDLIPWWKPISTTSARWRSDSTDIRRRVEFRVVVESSVPGHNELMRRTMLDGLPSQRNRIAEQTDQAMPAF
jgi:hypothetical protein